MDESNNVEELIIKEDEELRVEEDEELIIEKDEGLKIEEDEELKIEEDEELEEDDGPVCRMCHGEIDLTTDMDKVISPCMCTGSLALVHIDCFNRWGRNRCELCKFRFFAGEEAYEPQPEEDGQNPFVAEFEIDMDDFRQPGGQERLANRLVERATNFIPPADENGYRTRTLFTKLSEPFIKIYTNNYSATGILFSLWMIWCWHIREICITTMMEIPKLLRTALFMAILSATSVITIPAFLTYYWLKTNRIIILGMLLGFSQTALLEYLLANYSKSGEIAPQCSLNEPLISKLLRSFTNYKTDLLYK